MRVPLPFPRFSMRSLRRGGAGQVEPKLTDGLSASECRGQLITPRSTQSLSITDVLCYSGGVEFVALWVKNVSAFGTPTVGTSPELASSLPRADEHVSFR